MKTRLTILLLLISIVGMGQDSGKLIRIGAPYVSRSCDVIGQNEDVYQFFTGETTIGAHHFIDSNTGGEIKVDSIGLLHFGNDTIPTLKAWDKYLEWCNDSVMVKDIEIDWNKLKYGLSNISDGVDATITRKWTGKYIKTTNESQPNYKGFIEWIRKEVAK